MTLKLGMQHWVLEYYQVCSNYDPGLTLTYFTASSNLVPCAFVWEKCKTLDLSETIVVYDLQLATDDQSDKKFLLTSKLCLLARATTTRENTAFGVHSVKKSRFYTEKKKHKKKQTNKQTNILYIQQWASLVVNVLPKACVHWYRLFAFYKTGHFAKYL